MQHDQTWQYLVTLVFKTLEHVKVLVTRFLLLLTSCLQCYIIYSRGQVHQSKLMSVFLRHKYN